VPAVDLARVFTNLTPSIPLSFKGGGMRFIERGFTPLLPTLPLPLLREGGQGDGLLNNLLAMYELNAKICYTQPPL
jgi:hypothetical protein